MTGRASRLVVVPLSLKQANALIERMHRHHKRVQGHRFTVGAVPGDAPLHPDSAVACAVVGRPVSRGCDPWLTAEVTRLVTDGGDHLCSFLYGACARAARELGYAKIQTYILADEPGTSLKAAGWVLDGVTAGGDWNHSAANAGKRRTDQPQCPKQRWVKVLRGTASSG